ncbi:MAG: MGMT family protein [Thermoplasmata archaeon]
MNFSGSSSPGVSFLGGNAPDDGRGPFLPVPRRGPVRLSCRDGPFESPTGRHPERALGDGHIAEGESRFGGGSVSTLARLRQVIARVPRGKVVTYGQVAAAGGLPGAARVTVWALSSAIGLPWHRVVGAGGRIALPGEEGQEQRLLLKMEGVAFRGNRVRMDLHNWTPRAHKARRDRAGEARSPRPPDRVGNGTSVSPRPRKRVGDGF